MSTLRQIFVNIPTPIFALILASIVTGSLAPAYAEDRADLDVTKIIGNRELPKVLYIVPWKKPVQTELASRPLVSILDEALAPVDRDEFRRHMQYDAQTRPKIIAGVTTNKATKTVVPVISTVKANAELDSSTSKPSK